MGCARVRPRGSGLGAKVSGPSRTQKTNIQRSRERLGKEFLHPSDGKQKAERQVKPQPWGKHKGNGETLPPVVGKHGAAAALERLERQEETAYRRLQVALEGGDRFQVQAAQDFWLKCSETLRRLDLAVEVARAARKPRFHCVRLKVSCWRSPTGCESPSCNS